MKDESYFRLQAARLLRALPETEEKIRQGTLSLTSMAKAQACFRKEDRQRKDQGVAPLSKCEKQEVLQSLAGESTRECDRKLATFFPHLEEIPEKTRPLTETMTLIQFSADQELLEMLERLKDLLAHKNYERRWDQLFFELAEIALQKLDKGSERQSG